MSDQTHSTEPNPSDMTPSESRTFALAAHADQRYGDLPYSAHLDAVAELVAPYGDPFQVVAYLHDVVEDTEVSLERVRERFGELVAQCVELLTDAPGADRKERKAKTYAKLASVSGATGMALVVKTADRLANVAACVADGKLSLLAVYRGEHAVFRQAAFREGLCDDLWERLDRLLGEASTP